MKTARAGRLLCPFFLLLSVSVLAVPTAARVGAEEPSVRSLPAKENVHLFLLIGQSNMAGRGKVEAEDLRPHPRVLVYNQAGKWQPAVDPLHFDKPNVVGVGLGKTFGLIIAETDPQITVGLIPCAVGGSPIRSWEPGAEDAATKTHPYDDMLARCEGALKAGTLKGILWHQGESDANESQSPLYAERLHALIARVRKDLEAPEVPFLVGQLGQFKDNEWNEFKRTVDAVHRELPAVIANTGFVSSAGLNHKGDRVHFDSAAYREFGKRYAAKYLEMQASGKTANK